MSAINFKAEPFSICNPYRSYLPSFEGRNLNTLFQKKVPNDRILDFADEISDWGKTLLFNNYEKQIDFMAKVDKILEWGVYGIVYGIESPMIMDKIAHFHLEKLPILETFPFLYKILSIPTNVFLLSLTLFEELIEFLNLKRAGQLLKNLEKRKQNPLDAFNWIKAEYFTLEKSQEKKIYQFIERTLPNLSSKEKEKRFTEIAGKALQIKYDRLKRRITPGLAEEVVSQLNTIQKDLGSIFPNKRAEAKQRAEILIQSMSRQAKNKILIHVLGIVAIASTIVSFLFYIAGAASIALIVILGAITVSLTVISMIINRGAVAKEVEKFYDMLAKVNLQIKGNSAHFPSWIKALSRY